MKIIHSLYLVILTLSIACLSYSQSVTGYLSDPTGENLPGGNVYILSTNTGTSTNLDGFYTLILAPGTHQIVFSYMGYQNDTITFILNPGKTIRKDVILKESPLQFESVNVYAEKYNSAEMIILTAIERKNEYLSKIKNYVYDAYIKTVFLVQKDSINVIGGITEVQSVGYFQLPDKFQEIVLAKKQTANFSDFFNVFTTGRIISTLDDIIHIDELAVISPLNTNTLDYYNFEMIDTTFFNSKRVFQISVKPKKENLPLFEGEISIIDKIFTIIKVHLWGKERIKATIKSDVEIYQSFREFENYFWLPVQSNLFFNLDMGLPGVKKLGIKQYGQLTNYVLNDVNFEHKFSNKIIKHSDDYSLENDSLWKSRQGLSLSEDEKQAYKSLDSLMATKNFIVKALLELPNLYISIKKMPATKISDFYRFNRVEGSYAGIGFDSKEYINRYNFKLIFGYGFSDKKTNYSFETGIEIIPDVFTLLGGYKKSITFLDPHYDYHRLDISFQGLILRNDYADYYYSKGWYIGGTLQLSQNFKASGTYTKHEDSNAFTTNDYSVFGNRDLRNDVQVSSGKFNELTLSLNYDNRKYRDFGWGNIQDNSRNFLRIQLDGVWAPRDWNSDIWFSQVNLALISYNKIPPFFNISFSFLGGYLDNNSMIQRRFHLPGSYGSFTNPRMFRTLRNDNYVGKYYLCFFLENNFKNTLFNLLSVPFFKQSKYDLYLFGNFGWMNNIEWENSQGVESIKNIPFSEIGFGLGNILLFLRLDFAWRISHRTRNNFSFRITSSLNY